MTRVVETRSILEIGHARTHRNIERGGHRVRSARAVRKTVEDTLSGLLEDEADDLVGPSATSAPPSGRRTAPATMTEA